ncbi:TAP-like protein-domain-containing protein [Trametes elegans]|nr:TAP-like protein-domain-containing protein [Trametes elegans]
MPQNINTIQWGRCDQNLVVDSSLSCGFLEVPLDYHNTSAGNGRLALIKANATTDDRLGTMFYNPGGPGVSGITALDAISPVLLNYTGGRYDIVSWDTRGVGTLTVPGDVFCFDSVDDYDTFWADTLEVKGIEMTGKFTDRGDISQLLTQANITQSKYDELGKRCLSHKSGRLLQYVGTAATVRDLVALADALDGHGASVNYWGISYGTIIGSWLINMFPERMGRIILDGVVDPVAFSQIEPSLGWSTQLIDSDKTYAGFYTGCALAGPEGCPIASAGQSPEEVDQDIQSLLQKAHNATVRNAFVPVTSGIIRGTLRPAMYSPSGWANFANTTYQAYASRVAQELHRGTNISSNTAIFTGYRHTKRQASETSPYSSQAILCGDSVDLGNTTMTDVFKSIIQNSRNVSQMFSAAWPSVPYYCSFWPVRAVERYQGPFNKTLSGHILVIGNTYDPVTPFRSAELVAELHGSQARLVRLNTFGHTSEASPSTCIRDIITQYMGNGTLPDDNDTTCQADTEFEPFPGVNVESIILNLPETIVR